MIIKTYTVIDRGLKRKENQDYIKIIEPTSWISKLKGNLYIVCDGVGGLNNGRQASMVAAEIIARKYYRNIFFNIKRSLSFAIKKANKELFKLSKKEKMGTTVVVLALKKNQAFICNVGDSRAYIFKKNQLIKITQDHTFVAEKVRLGQLTEEEALSHPMRNIILRCLGENKNVLIDFHHIVLAKTQKLMLCSDGLWGEVSKTEIEDILKEGTNIEERLLKKVYEKGASDNIAVLVLDILAE